MLTGVGMLEVDAIEEVRSCLIGSCGSWIEEFSGAI
jgi:hypothetical protein